VAGTGAVILRGGGGHCDPPCGELDLRGGGYAGRRLLLLRGSGHLGARGGALQCHRPRGDSAADHGPRRRARASAVEAGNAADRSLGSEAACGDHGRPPHHIAGELQRRPVLLSKRQRLLGHVVLGLQHLHRAFAHLCISRQHHACGRPTLCRGVGHSPWWLVYHPVHTGLYTDRGVVGVQLRCASSPDLRLCLGAMRPGLWQHLEA